MDSTVFDLRDTLFLGGYGVSGVAATEIISNSSSHDDVKFWLMAGYFGVSTLVVLVKQVLIPLYEINKKNNLI